MSRPTFFFVVGAVALCLSSARIHAQVPAAGVSSKVSEPQGRVRVTVQDAISGQPISGATVEVVEISSGETRHPTTNAEGVAEVLTLPPGTYRVGKVTAEGYSNRLGPTVVLEDDFADAGVVELRPGSSVYGRVLDSSGVPVAGADVAALREAFLSGRRTVLVPGRAVTGVDGSFEIGGLRAGRYFFRVSYSYRMAPAFEKEWTGVFQTTYYPNVTSMEESVPVEVGSGTSASPVDIRVHAVPTFHVRGTVTGYGPESGAIVVDLRECQGDGEQGEFLKSGVLEDDGFYEIASVPPGQYCLSAVNKNPPRRWAAKKVTVTNRDLRDVNLAAARAWTMQGRLLREDESIRLPLSVSLHPTDMFAYPLTSGQVDRVTGEFVLEDVRDSEYWAEIIGVGAGTGGYLQSVKVGAREIDPTNFTLAQDEGPLVIELGVASGTVTGQVDRSSIDGGIWAYLVPTMANRGRTDLMYRAVVSRAGVFQFFGVAPGSYQVVVLSPYDGDLVQMPEFFELLRGQTVNVRNNQTVNISADLTSTREIEAAVAAF